MFTVKYLTPESQGGEEPRGRVRHSSFGLADALCSQNEGTRAVQTPILVYMNPSSPRAAIITGGSRGIGAAIARLLGASGYSIAFNYLSDEAAARSVLDQLTRTGVRAVAVQADLAREADILRLFEIADRELGPPRALVNNAAVTGGFARVEQLEAAKLANMLAVNISGTMLCAREAVRRMSKRHGGAGGGIVNISSLAARTGSAGEWVHYAATKGAVNTFTIGLAREVAAEGIRVNAVAPGLIDTSLHAANGEPGRLSRMAPSIPMQRGGTPDEIAQSVLWLLSDAASYVTGSILEVGGGR
jgi:NAD(P)-dependent dehydrogenase (short-subunit alcohol dehydrogenase family)